MHRRIITILGLFLLAVSGASHGDACTYREAIMALEQGNAVRGMALMRMASRDGDSRARGFLARVAAEKDAVDKEVVLKGNNKSQPALALVDSK